jgi:hypothetical protein
VAFVECGSCQSTQHVAAGVAHTCTQCGEMSKEVACRACDKSMRVWTSSFPGLVPCPLCSTPIQVGAPPTGSAPVRSPGIASGTTLVAQPPAPVQHLLHIGLCILTAGIWLPVYACVMISYSLKRNVYWNARAQEQAANATRSG